MAFYCGNNYFEMGRRPLGTPYECMKRGVGAGLHGDLANFSPRYRPIFPNNKFCGRGRSPPGKVKGKPHECLSKGYGVGLKLQYNRQRGYRFGERSELKYDVFIFICAIITLVTVQMIFREWFLTFIIFMGVVVLMYYLNRL